MHAHQHRAIAVLHIAVDQGHVRFAIDLAFIRQHTKLAVAGLKVRFPHPMNQTFVRHAVANQFGDREHLQLVLLTKLRQVGDAGHGAVIVHDLADHAGGHQPG